MSSGQRDLRTVGIWVSVVYFVAYSSTVWVLDDNWFRNHFLLQIFIHVFLGGVLWSGVIILVGVLLDGVSPRQPWPHQLVASWRAGMLSSLALSPAYAPSVHSALGQVPDSVSVSYFKNYYIKGNHILLLQLFRIFLIFKSWQTEQTDHEMTGNFPLWGRLHFEGTHQDTNKQCYERPVCA